MRRITIPVALLATVGLLVVLVTSLVRSQSAATAAQADPTATPIVIELVPQTPADAGKVEAGADATATPRVILIATLPPTQEPATAPTEVPARFEVAFEADDWIGGFYQQDPALQDTYGRPWLAIYGAASDYPRATLAFELDEAPTTPVVMTLSGLDDELETLNRIAVDVNGARVYEGDSFFANWDMTTGDPTVWSQVRLTIAPELLRDDENAITLLNLEPEANVEGPPYILLGEGMIAADVEVEIETPDEDVPPRADPEAREEAEEEVEEDEEEDEEED